jgi:hypothetical protein
MTSARFIFKTTNKGIFASKSLHDTNCFATSCLFGLQLAFVMSTRSGIYCSQEITFIFFSAVRLLQNSLKYFGALRINSNEFIAGIS